MSRHAYLSNKGKVRCSMTRHPKNEPDQTLRLIDQAILCLYTLGAQGAHNVERLGELRSRLEGGQFHLAVLGQFKRGKSTLLNALLGQEILATGIVPLT